LHHRHPFRLHRHPFSLKQPIGFHRHMCELLFEERPSIPAAIPPAPTPNETDEADQKKRKSRKKAMSFLREDEVARLFSVIHSVRDRAIFLVAYRAGLRASE